MSIKIVSDSSANLTEFGGLEFVSVPLHIIVGDREFVDDKGIDVGQMQEALDSYKGKTSTSCPSPDDWLQAFGDADSVFCITITSALSGSFSSANIAARMYEQNNPGRKVYLIDSLSTGPELVLFVEKINELASKGMEASDIYDRMCQYVKHTRLYFSLASLNNLARNGRVNPILAKGVGLLGIRIVGKASDEGTLQPMHKGRGDKKAIEHIINSMKECGYKHGRTIIAHYSNPEGAEALKRRIEESFGQFNGFIHKTTGLCSYYAEPQSILIGFECE
ncbi:MAG: DegV family protein [Lachnospiraceae bacterium]